MKKLLIELRDKIDNDYTARIDATSMRNVDKLHACAMDDLDAIDRVIMLAGQYEMAPISARLTATDALAIGAQQAIAALEVCGEGASKAQILNQIAYAKGQINVALRAYYEAWREGE